MIVATGLAATWAMAEHASTGLQPAVAMPVDVLHLLAVAAWLGGLAALVVSLYWGPPVERAAVRRFSRIAFGSVVVLVATGLYQSWRQVGTWRALTDTAYGRLLLIKVALVVVLVGIAWLSRQWTGRLAEVPAGEVAAAELRAAEDAEQDARREAEQDAAKAAGQKEREASEERGDREAEKATVGASATTAAATAAAATGPAPKGAPAPKSGSSPSPTTAHRPPTTPPLPTTARRPATTPPPPPAPPNSPGSRPRCVRPGPSGSVTPTPSGWDCAGPCWPRRRSRSSCSWSPRC